MMIRNILVLSPNGDSLTGTSGSIDHRIAVTAVKTAAGAKRELLSNRYDLFVSRCDTLDRTQSALLGFVKDHRIPTLPVLVPKRASIDDAVYAMKLGAGDLLVSEHLGDEFLHTLLQRLEQEDSVETPPSSGDESDPPGTTFVGKSPAIAEILPAIDLVAKSQAAVFITGESGTGKEVVARLIHRKSSRNRGPFIALNCAAFPRDVIENELFGHEKGAFTGAIAVKTGAFEFADGGTLFFDEIGEMSPEVQAKLLRAIEEKSFRRLGGKEELHVDVRIVAATNKNIAHALESGELREDLYYRFSVIEIALPPLRDRPEDIPLLVEHFLSILCAKYGRERLHVSGEAMELLCSYCWPGNIRELKNLVERAVVTCLKKTIEVGDLPERMGKQKPVERSVIIPVGSSFEEAERKIILQTLAWVRNNKSQAARVLGLSRQTLLNKLRRIDMTIQDHAESRCS